jgi:hypothetical protein
VRRTLSFAAAWLVVAVLALVVAWQGVSVVADQVTNRRPAPLGAEEVRRQLDREAAAAAPTAAPSTSDLAPATTVTTLRQAAAPLTSTPPPTTAASPTPGAVSPASTAPPATAPPPPATTGPPPATTAPAPAAETRTYNLVGGSASLSYSPAGVSVVFATPKPGFEVDVEPQNGNGVRVEFESDEHRSRVEGWWDGGPQERVREEPG